MKTQPTLLLALMLVLGGPIVAAPPQTPPKTPIVLGTEQLPGDFGALGQTYTIGKREPLNVTLRSAAYSIEPFVSGTNCWVPRADEKVLYLRLTVHNPNPQDVSLHTSSLKLTAVDQTDTNRIALDGMVREGTQEEVGVSLKPAQKLDVVMAILVPAAGVAPKLIVQREWGTPVIRYDLRARVAALPEYAADATDPKGASVRKQPLAKPGTFYPVGVFDVRLDLVGVVDGTLAGRALGAGRQWFTVAVTLKNRTNLPQRYVWSDFVPELRDADGDLAHWNQALLKAGRDETTYGNLDPGAEVRVRFFFDLPQGAKAGSLTLREGKRVNRSLARPFLFDLTAAPRF